MKYIQAEVKIIFDQKPLFFEKITYRTICVSVPVEWNKDRTDRFIAEAARSLIKQWPVSKKKTYRIIVMKKKPVAIFNEGTKYFEYDFDDKHGEWEKW